MQQRLTMANIAAADEMRPAAPADETFRPAPAIPNMFHKIASYISGDADPHANSAWAARARSARGTFLHLVNGVAQGNGQ